LARINADRPISAMQRPTASATPHLTQRGDTSVVLVIITARSITMSTRLSRRRFLTRALFAAGATALPLALPGITPRRASAATFGDSIYLRNIQSEQSKAFSTANSTVVTNSLGIAGRRLEAAGATFTFRSRGASAVMSYEF
jgi:hypothetical protein